MTRNTQLPQYLVGQIIHHRRYDYRGVVVAVDPSCHASEAWYGSNQTQPRRDQPWYHVLVDGGRETYVAEENLETDPGCNPIQHPLVDRFFPTFQSGRYYRDSLN